MEQIERRLYNLKSVANILDVSVATIYRRLDSDPFFPKPKLVEGRTFGRIFRLKSILNLLSKEAITISSTSMLAPLSIFRQNLPTIAYIRSFVAYTLLYCMCHARRNIQNELNIPLLFRY